MQTLIFAKFPSVGQAEEAFAGLLELDARAEDLTIAGLQTSEDETLIDQTQSLDESDRLEDRPEGAAPITPDRPEHEEFPTIATPFGLVPGAPRVLVSARKPNDLTSRLSKMGIGDSISKALTDWVMDGGALLLAQMPSGEVNEKKAWRLIEGCGGTGLAKGQVDAYIA